MAEWTNRAQTIIPSIAFSLVVLVAWQILVPALNIPKYLLPTPSQIIQEGVLANWDRLLMHTEVTLYESVAGFVIGALLGVSLAIALSFSSLMRSMLYPSILTVHVIPKSAVAPLIVLWLGLGSESKVVIAILVAFFPIVINTAAGFFAVPPEFLELTRSVNGRTTKVLGTLQLPYALPYIYDGLKIGITMAVIGAVVGEFVAAAKGLGYLVLISMVEMDTSEMFAGLLALAVITFALYGAVILVERMTIPWYFSMREAK
jgi:NitT/TauT family transport system permease protein